MILGLALAMAAVLSGALADALPSTSTVEGVQAKPALQAAREASPCVLVPDKRADPARIPLGDRTRVTLSARPDCPARTEPLEVVLVIDNSGSMAADSKLTLAKRAASTFLRRIDFKTTRVGVVSFQTTSQVVSQLSDDETALRDAIDGIVSQGSTNIVAALDDAARVLVAGRNDSHWPAGVTPIEVVVLLSDGRHTAGGGDPGDDPRELANSAALRLRGAGAILATVCLGDDCDRLTMSLSASSRSLYFDSPTAAELVDIYERIAERLRRPSVAEVRVRDVIPDNMDFLINTAEPAPDDIQGNTVIWNLDDVPLGGFEIRYWLRPTELGLWPTNVEAVAEFTDIFERVGEAVFPVPTVAVSQFAYLPLALRERCDPKLRSVDVVLLLDASSSMRAPAVGGDVSKRVAALRAAHLFVDQMRLVGAPGGAAGGGTRDRVAVIGFDSSVYSLSGLRNDAAGVHAALDALPEGQGTRIDLGLLAARDLFNSEPPQAGRTRAIVLLTDGRPSTGNDEVLMAASAARRRGTTIFSVGLGADVDAGLLRAVAGDGTRYRSAGDAASLQAIYQQLAVEVPCPGGRHDWGKSWP
jgi:Mg-chelatase subunit ChlD